MISTSSILNTEKELFRSFSLWFRQLLGFTFLKEKYLGLEFWATGLRSFINSACKGNGLLWAEVVSPLLGGGPSWKQNSPALSVIRQTRVRCVRKCLKPTPFIGTCGFRFCFFLVVVGEGGVFVFTSLRRGRWNIGRWLLEMRLRLGRVAAKGQRLEGGSSATRSSGLWILAETQKCLGARLLSVIPGVVAAWRSWREWLLFSQVFRN